MGLKLAQAELYGVRYPSAPLPSDYRDALARMDADLARLSAAPQTHRVRTVYLRLEHLRFRMSRVLARIEIDREIKEAYRCHR